MTANRLKILKKPKLKNPSLLLGFSGWMDGGDVSTGTIRYLAEKSQARNFAYIEPEDFYIYNFPGSMEISALFRPHTIKQTGVISTYIDPTNTCLFDEKNNLILFAGREPNLAWQQYADCIFDLCEQFSVEQICFIGSVAGLTPHTREPRIFCSASDEKLKSQLHRHGLRFTNYQGPASIITYLMVRSSQMGLNMISLVAEIPAYVQGYNPGCIETVIKCIAGILDLHIHLDDLRTEGDEFEKKLSLVVQRQPELAEKIGELEQAYDDEIFNTEMTDLKSWLEQQGIRVD